MANKVNSSKKTNNKNGKKTTAKKNNNNKYKVNIKNNNVKKSVPKKKEIVKEEIKVSETPILKEETKIVELPKTKKEVKENKVISDKKKNIIKEIATDVIIVLVVILIRMYLFSPIRVNGDSMKPTLLQGETMILNKISLVKGIDRYDIVVVDSYDDDFIIKRVIGLPGESVAYIEGKLYINGKYVEDKYSLSTTEDFKEVKLGEDEYFVMGDNRAVSKDSRMIGAVNLKQIKGKANFILFPLSKIGKVND